MRKQLHTILAIIISAVVLISCQPNFTSSSNGQNGDIQDIRVQVAEPTKTTSKVEQFPLPNCGGSDKLAQSLGTFASVSKSATVGTKAAVTGGGEVAVPETAKLKLEIQVEQAYQQTFESANSRLDTIVMSAAAGTHVVYTIVWEEQTFNSVVQYSSDGKVYEVPYTYVLSVPKIDKSYNVICDGNNTGNNGSGNIIPTQPVIISQPQTTKICYGQCWKFDDSSRTMTWYGLSNGTEDIWQPDGEALQKIREGYTAIITTSVPGEIFSCILAVNGETVNNSCNGFLYQVPAGTFQIKSQNNDVGGFRWCPLAGYGWRVNGGECK